MIAPTSAEADRAAIRRAGFPAFYELWARQKYGRGYVHAWHARLMAEHAQALYDGRLSTLLCSILPGAMKSDVFSRAFPAWIWAQDPSYRFIRASYLTTVANKFGSDTREICESRWFKDRWGDIILGRHPLRPNGVNEYWTVADGYSLSASIGGGSLVSRHARMMIIDDPIKAQSAVAEDPKLLDNVWAWYDAVAKTRGTIGAVQRMLCVAQRFHEHDLNGLLIERYTGRDKFAHLCLPWHYEPERACVTSIGRDPRTREGEELFDDENSREKVADALVYGPKSPVYRSQYQQDPKSGAARYFPAETLLDFAGAPPLRECVSVMSIDPTFTGKERSDLMAIDVWGFKDGHFYCYYAEQARRDFQSADGKEGALDAIRRVRSLWGVQNVLVEATANGAAILSMLRNEIVGLVEIKPMGGKKERAFAASKFFHAGRVHFDKQSPWYAEKARYLVRFPSPGLHDDPVDTATQAINWIEEKYGASVVFADAMAAIDENRGGDSPPEEQTLAGQMARYAREQREKRVVEVKQELGVALDWRDVLGLDSMAISDFE